MKKLFVLLFLTTFFACKSNVDTYRAGIEDLSTQWDATTGLVGQFSDLVKSTAGTQLSKITTMAMDEAVFSKLKPEMQTQYTEAKDAAVASTTGFSTILETVGTYVTDWTANSAKLTSLKDGLAAGKLEGDVPAQMTEITSLITGATETLGGWQTAFDTAKTGSEAATDNFSKVFEMISATVTKK